MWSRFDFLKTIHTSRKSLICLSPGQVMDCVPGLFSTEILFSAERCSPPLAQHSRKSYDFLVSCTLGSHASAVVVGPPKPPPRNKQKKQP